MLIGSIGLGLGFSIVVEKVDSNMDIGLQTF